MGIDYGEQPENLNNQKALFDPNYKGPAFF